MTTYTDVFGSSTVPAADEAFSAISLTASAALFWPQDYVTTGYVVTDIMEVTATAGLTLTLPDATAVSVGQAILLRNVGAETFTLNDNGAGAVTTITAGVSKYVYLADNSTAAGTWRVFTYGTGTSAADANELVGYGLEVSGNTLQVDFEPRTISGAYSVVAADRGRTIVASGGAYTISLPTAASVGAGFFFALSNTGTGSVTVDCSGAETIDSSGSKGFDPTESAFILSTASEWVTVGFGQALNFAFSEYNITSTGGSVSLTSSDVSGRMVKVPNALSSNLTVNLPAIVGIYFFRTGALGASKTVTIQVTGGLGAAFVLLQNEASGVYCDGVNCYSAATFSVTGEISLSDGTAGTPSLTFASDLDTGIYRIGANNMGFSAGGAKVLETSATGAAVTGTLDVSGIATLGTNSAVSVSPTLGDSSTKIATTAFVAATSFSTNLPAQGGNGGKFLTTDGASASWDDVLPDQTGNDGKFLSTNGTVTSWASVLKGGASLSGSQTLTSTSAGAISWTPTALAQALTLPDATTLSTDTPKYVIHNASLFDGQIKDGGGTLLGFVLPGGVATLSLVDASTAAGTWIQTGMTPMGKLADTTITAPAAVATASVIQAVDIGSSREMWFFNSTGGASNTQAVIYDTSANTFGAVVLVRALNLSISSFRALAIGGGSVLVCTCAGSAAAFEAVVLTTSGTTITVNTAATKTLAANTSSTLFDLIAVGSSYLIGYDQTAAAPKCVAMTISGTTVTIGVEAAFATGSATSPGDLYNIDGTKALSIRSDGTNMSVAVVSVSGSTATVNAAVTTTGTVHNFSFSLGTRWAALFTKNGTVIGGCVISVSGTVPTISAVDLLTGTATPSSSVGAALIAGQVFVTGTDNSNTAGYANVMTDTAGTASAGTQLSWLATNGSTFAYNYGLKGSTFYSSANINSDFVELAFTVSGANAVVSRRTLGTNLVAANTGVRTSGVGIVLSRKDAAATTSYVSATRMVSTTDGGFAYDLVYDSGVKIVPAWRRSGSSPPATLSRPDVTASAVFDRLISTSTTIRAQRWKLA